MTSLPRRKRTAYLITLSMSKIIAAYSLDHEVASLIDCYTVNGNKSQPVCELYRWTDAGPPVQGLWSLSQKARDGSVHLINLPLEEMNRLTGLDIFLFYHKEKHKIAWNEAPHIMKAIIFSCQSPCVCVCGRKREKAGKPKLIGRKRGGKKK